MVKPLLTKAHIAKLKELTESEVTELMSSTVNEIALAILKRQRSRGISIVFLQMVFMFHIHVDPYWPKWQTKSSKLAAKDFETSEFHHDTWNRYLLLGFIWAHSAWNSISNLELQWSYIALRDDLVLPSTKTISKICRREYAMTVDGIPKQFPSRNRVSLPLDGWTSMNKLAIRSVIAYYRDRNWAIREVQLGFYKLDRLFFSAFER